MQKLDIIYQDKDYVAVNKPAGILVHPYKSESNDRVTILSLLRDQLRAYVYPLHRLDRPVSGALIFAKSSEAASLLATNWDSSKKEYLLLCKGKTAPKGAFTFELQNEKKQKQSASTKYLSLYHFKDDFSLVKASIETGRKHQLRRHFEHARHAIIGDSTYGKGPINHWFKVHTSLKQLFLHAYSFEFDHPKLQKKILIKASIPKNLILTLDRLHFPIYKIDLENLLKAKIP